MPDSRPHVTIYTDGGASPNPGPGGWGAVLLADDDEPTELAGGSDHTTNNRMELTAACEALRSLPEPSRVDLYTDSTYLRNGVTAWLPGWIRRGWKRKGGALQNVDLWRELARLIERHRVRWHWVRGHAGNRWNERADELATAAMPGRVDRQAAGDRGEPADVEIFLGVSCRGKRGAWAGLLRRGSEETAIGDAAYPTTAPRLEILSAAAALEALPEPTTVAVHTRSDYLRNGAAGWLAGWKRGGWKTKSGQPVKNRDAWQRLDAQLRRHRVRWPERREPPQPEFAELDRAAHDRLA